MRFEGEFVPPTIGRNAVPIKVAGRGTLELTDAGLVASGFAARSGMAILGAILGAIVAGLATYALKLLVFYAMTAKSIVIAAVGGLVAGAAVPIGGKPNKPRSFAFPWPSVRNVEIEEGVILVRIKKAKPNGTLHFRPDGDPAAALAALHARPE